MFIKEVSLNSRARLAMGGVLSFGVGFTSWYYFPNTIFINKMKEIVQLYRYGAPVPVPLEVTELFETALSDVKINPRCQSMIKPFTVYGFDMFRAGSTSSAFGAIIGIPSNLYYNDINDVETSLITVQNETKDWVSEEGENLKNSFVYSDNAKKFLLAREILMVDSPLMFLRCLYPVSITLFVYTLAHNLNRKLKLLQRPILLRVIMYGLVGLFGLGSWAFLQDFSTVHYESEADKKLSTLGKKYIEGGIEVYSKILQRNISLRELMKRKGPSTYTATGNDFYFLRLKHLPLTSRKEYFEKQLIESENGSDSEASPDAPNTL